MIEKKSKKLIKVIIASVLIAVCALLFWPNDEAKAFDWQIYDVTEFKGDKTSANWTYPTKPGKVFAGWYEDEACTTVYRDTTGNAYAKFVDEKVLSVAKQFRTVTKTTSDKTDIRFLTSIDTLKFYSVGFEVSVDCEPARNFDLEETYAFTSVLEDGKTKYPKDVFDKDESKYFVMYSITGIPNAVFNDTFTVKPYWNTMDGTKVYGVTKTFDIISELTQKVTLDDTTYIEKSSAETMTVDLAEVQDVLNGGTLVSATVDGTAFGTASYADNKLTLDTATLGDVGAKNVTATFKAADGEPVVVSAPVTVCTMIINDEAELNTLPSTIYANGGAGYYVLGNDVVCTGTYPRCEWDAPTFTGTFDGCGNNIYNLTTAHSEGDWYQGFLGITSTGTIKNVSFINAKHGGMGGFIATTQNGTVENVYVQIAVTPYEPTDGQGSWGGLRTTSVIGGQTNSNTRFNKVFVEYINPLPSGATSGNAVAQYCQGYGSYNGLYVIGAQQIMNERGEANDNPTTDDVFGAYTSRDAFKADNVDVEAWENEFWTVKEGIPTPKNLREVSKVTLSNTAVETANVSTFVLNLSSLSDELNGGTLLSAVVDGTAFGTASYADSVLTLDTATLGDYGTKKVTATFAAKSGKIVLVTIPVTACSMVINDEAELNTLPSTIYANGGAGYYALGNDIVCTGTYPRCEWDAPAFTGTFDGCGNNIYNLTTAHSEGDWYQGFLGITSTGTIKNVSFINAKHGGMGGFIATYQEGTVENVYIQITLTPYVFENAGDYWGGLRATSVIGGQTNMNTRVNKVFIEYINPLPNGTNCGHAVYQMHQGFGSYNGLYVIGAEKVMSEVLTSNVGDTYGAYANRDAFKTAGVDVSAWENDFWTVVEGIPTPKKLRAVSNVTLESNTAVGKYDALTFAIDLSSLSNELNGGTLTSATVDGIAFGEFSYADNTLTLDTTTLSGTGAKTVNAVFTTANGSIVSINAPITVYTLMISNEYELNSLPTVIRDNGGAGHYILTNDIVCTGTYPRCNWDAPTFTGTFDGCGNNIYNLTTAHSEGDWYQGFLGITSTGTIKNVSFINAKHGGMGGFIATTQNGTVENVYVQIAVTPYEPTDGQGSWGGLRTTSVIGGQTNSNTRFNKVFVEYIDPLPSGATSGNAVAQYCQGYGSYNGLYVIGAQQIMNERGEVNDNPTTDDVFGAYASRDAFKASVNVSAWENEFWTVVNGIPTPKKLAK